MPHQQT